jgi:hypothetical protein
MLEAPHDDEGGLREIRPEDVGARSIILDGRAQQTAITDFEPGDIVSPDDRGNLGEVVSVDAKGVLVRLTDKYKGRTAELYFPAGALDLIRRRSPLRELLLLSFSALLALPPARWLIKKVLRLGELGVLFGASGCGKTFLALDMSFRVAVGLEWWGYPVVPAPVLYIAAEGLYSVRERAVAWIQQFGEAGDKYREVLERNFTVLGDAVSFLDPQGFELLVKKIESMSVKPGLTVVDTLARTMAGGDENSAKDMGLYVQACDRIRKLTKGTVLLVHHAGKQDERSERGSSALRGAADAMFVAAKEGKLIRLDCDKQKEGEPIPSLYFELDVVDVGCDVDGKPRTSARLKSSTAIPLTFAKRGAKQMDDGDAGLRIQRALAEGFFENGAAGTNLLAAADVPRSSFYKRLKALIEGEKFVERFKDGRHDRYRLTPASPYYKLPVSVSVSQVSETVSETEPSVSVSSLAPPLRGATETETETASEGGSSGG